MIWIFIIFFQVNNKIYPIERLQIKNNRQVNPNAEDLIKIRQDLSSIKNSYKTWTTRQPDNLILRLPVQGRKSSKYGLKRILNGIEKQPHSGLDIAAAKGELVLAAANGKIIEIGNYFYNGNTIFIDHGKGLITSYSHLDQTLVKAKQTVKMGEPIGTVGNTGRATGPHLHWSVSLNDVRVDPELFL